MAGSAYAILAPRWSPLPDLYRPLRRILRAPTEIESRMLARLAQSQRLYLPLLFTTLMLCALAKH